MNRPPFGGLVLIFCRPSLSLIGAEEVSDMEVVKDLVILSKAIKETKRLAEEEEDQRFFEVVLKEDWKPNVEKYVWAGGDKISLKETRIILYDEKGDEYECPADTYISYAWGETERGEGQNIVDFIVDLLSENIIPTRFRVITAEINDNEGRSWRHEAEGRFTRYHWEIIRQKLCSYRL